MVFGLFARLEAFLFRAVARRELDPLAAARPRGGLLLRSGTLGDDLVGDFLQLAGVVYRQTSGHKRVAYHGLLVQKLEPHASAQILTGNACVAGVVGESLAASARVPTPACMKRPPLLGKPRVLIGSWINGEVSVEPPSGKHADCLERVADRNHPTSKLTGNRGVSMTQTLMHDVGGKVATAKQRVVLSIGPGLVNEHLGLRAAPLDVVIELLCPGAIGLQLKALDAGLLNSNVIPFLSLKQVAEARLAGIGTGGRVTRVVFKGLRQPHVLLQWASSDGSVGEREPIPSGRGHQIAEEVSGVAREAVAYGQQAHMLACWRCRLALGFRSPGRNRCDRE